jgi:transcriptional regulator with PAS, ATPase and Fis domain
MTKGEIPVSETTSQLQDMVPSQQARIEYLQNKVQELNTQLEMTDLVFDHIQNGALVTNPDGYITKFNRPYAEFMEIEPEDMIGKYVVDVIDNTRMHIVAKTGEPETMIIQRIKGKDIVVQRIPIKKNGQVIAVFGQIMFKGLKEVRSLARSLEIMESKVKLYEKELRSLRKTRYSLQSIKGTSSAMTRLREEVRKAAEHNLPVLISGESGSGKEVVAQAIHSESARRHNPFVRINCSAIPKELFESELFGYAKGAFTGALSEGKPGKFELARGGTIFLDEVGEMPLEMQPKLLQVLEEKVFERVGGTEPIFAECRVMAATNQNLEAMLAKRLFRGDLFYRLNVFRIHISPLRSHPEDIKPIADFLLEQISEEFKGGRYHLNPDAMEMLQNYDWPGNVRELNNVLERTLALIDGKRIRAEDLPFFLKTNRSSSSKGDRWDLKGILSQAEKRVLIDALSFTKNNKAKSAKLLRVDRAALYRKMQKYNIPL